MNRVVAAYILDDDDDVDVPAPNLCLPLRDLLLLCCNTCFFFTVLFVFRHSVALPCYYRVQIGRVRHTIKIK